MCIFVAEASLSARTLLSPLSCLSCLSLQAPYSPNADGVACFGVRPWGSCTSQHSQISKCSSGKSPDPPGERETGKHPAQAGRAQLGKATLGTRCCLPQLLPSKGRKSLTEPRLEESGSSLLRVFTARAPGQHHVQVCLNKACSSLCTTAWVQLHRSSDAPQRFHLPFVISES